MKKLFLTAAILFFSFAVMAQHQIMPNRRTSALPPRKHTDGAF